MSTMKKLVNKMKYLTIPEDFKRKEFIKHDDFNLELCHVGQGNWRAFQAIGINLTEIMDIAQEWRNDLYGIDKPWLCWNVDDDWNLVQQKLVRSVGWTPLVGFDPRKGPPKKVLKESVVFDFNRQLNLPLLYPHFPLEFAFLFVRKIAFWHSDLLIRQDKMGKLAKIFETLQNGETAATYVSPGWRDILGHKKKRYWELVGCTTQAASLDQFEKGCGWWMEFRAHHNLANGERIGKKFYWDHGAGIYYWEKELNGRVKSLDGREFEEGHFTKINNNNYHRTRSDGWSDATRSMSKEIVENFSLQDACDKLLLNRFLE